MSQEHVEIVRDHYAATNERDFARALSHYAEDVELVTAQGFIGGGTFSGVAQVGGWFGDWLGTFDKDARFEISEIRALDASSVLLTATFHARGRASGVRIEGEVSWLYRLRAGKITHVRGFESREEALTSLEPEG